jgi:hypothetical protein
VEGGGNADAPKTPPIMRLLADVGLDVKGSILPHRDLFASYAGPNLAIALVKCK